MIQKRKKKSQSIKKISQSIKKISLSIIIMVAAIAITISLLRVVLGELLHMTDASTTALMTIGQVVASSVGAIMIVIQLAHESDLEEKQASIQEAQFIFNYNNTFIQDEKMTTVQHCLERDMLFNEKIVINEKNRQNYVNYLVYLEGMAPLILNNTLQLSHIDNLMAYRFFLAVNNRELQEVELIPYHDFYLGCYKLYYKWKAYRKEMGFKIPQEDYALDRWLEFEQHIDCEYKVRRAKENELPLIAEVLYGTDPYIYPAAFKSAKEARKCFPNIMRDKRSAFYFENIKVVVNPKGKIIGAICIYNSLVDKEYDYYSELGLARDETKHVCDKYFGHLTDAEYIDSPDTYYIIALCVKEEYQNKSIGQLLMKNVLLDNNNKTFRLHVLKDNINARRLYKKLGFEIIGDPVKGYALKEENRPDCYIMKREPSDEWLMKNHNEERKN